jgi:hypothetical protein
VLLGRRGVEVELAGRGRDEEGHGHGGRRGLLELLAQVCRERRQLLMIMLMLMVLLARGEIFLIQSLRR